MIFILSKQLLLVRLSAFNKVSIKAQKLNIDIFTKEKKIWRNINVFPLYAMFALKQSYKQVTIILSSTYTQFFYTTIILWVLTKNYVSFYPHGDYFIRIL